MIKRLWHRILGKLGWSVCSHCGEFGWGNDVGCMKMWMEWGTPDSDAGYDDDEGDVG